MKLHSLLRNVEKCKRMVEGYDWTFLGEKSSPASLSYEYSEDIADMLGRTRINPHAVIYGTFHTYP